MFEYAFREPDVSILNVSISFEETAMGNTVWVLSEETEEDEWDHSLLLAHEDALNRMADQLGITRLSDFYDHSILAEEYGEEIEPNFVETEEVEFVITSLLAAIREGNADSLNGDTELIEELNDCLEKVVIAKKQDCQVRLAIVP